VKHMKYVPVLAILLTAGVLAIAAGSAAGVIFLDHEKVTAALHNGATLVTQPDLIVMGAHRDKTGQVEVHDKETDVMYVVDGTATFVTGGEAVGLARTKPGQWLGSEIKGGESHHLTKATLS
jgi:hypothetical protein